MHVAERNRKLEVQKPQDITKKQLHHGHELVPSRPTGSHETDEQLYCREWKEHKFEEYQQEGSDGSCLYPNPREG